MQQYFFKRPMQKFMKYWSLSLIYKSSQIKDHSLNNRSENWLRITLNRLFVLGEIWVKVKYKELKVRKSIANSGRTAVLGFTARAHNLLISDKSSDHKVGIYLGPMETSLYHLARGNMVWVSQHVDYLR